MLPKQNRLPLRTEFSRVKKESQMIHGKFFSLLLAPSNKPPRFAFIVSKKIDKRATQRNHIRRLLAESVQSHLLGIKKKADVVFLVKKVIADQDLETIKNEVGKAFKKVGLSG